MTGPMPAGALRRVLALLALTAAVAIAAAPEAGASSRFCDALRSELRAGGSQGGLLVTDLGSGRRLCASAPDRRRIIASNMKLFTTATALQRLRPNTRIATTVWRVGRLDHRGTLHGDLYIRGAGDPALAMPAYSRVLRPRVATNFLALRAQVRRSGIRRVTGQVVADDSIFDRLRGVPASGWQTSQYIGPLSGLALNSGHTGPGARFFSRDPALLAAEKLARGLRAAGIAVRPRVRLGKLPPDPGGGSAGGGTSSSPGASSSTGRRERIALVVSPPMWLLSQQTNVHSDNFFAETLLKLIGARVAGRGTTTAGARVVSWFARAAGSDVNAVDGSGLSRGNMASPREIVALLRTMSKRPIGRIFRRTLPLSSRDGTLSGRMKGTPAERRCEAKTGTLTGVSALSGYCATRSGHQIAFSILMNSTWNSTNARARQDAIVARIAAL